jgi:arginase
MTAFQGRDITVQTELSLPRSRPERSQESGLLNEAALLAMIEKLYDRVYASLVADHFPFVYGADCAVLLAALPALRDALHEPGLVFIDGHEDATPMELSPNGEVANMEIALLLGLTGNDSLPPAIRTRVPALQPNTIVMLGQRDAAHRHPLNVPTLADRVLLHTPSEIIARPAEVGHNAAAYVAKHATGWWLHTDLDVLAEVEFAARGAPGEVHLPDGLSWRHLTEVILSILQVPGCRGWSVVIYNPDLDSDGSEAKRIITFLGQIAPSLP